MLNSSARVLVIGLILVFVAACSSEDGALPTQPKAPSPGNATPMSVSVQIPGVAVSADNNERTPFQQSIIRKVSERAAQGMPVAAELTFTYESESGAPLSSLMQSGLNPGESVTIVARTSIRYENPAQAGQTAWPAIVVEDEMPEGAEGLIVAGDYSSLIRETIEEANPGYWQQHEFGQEPRTYNFTETMTITFPASGADAASPGAAGTSTTDGEFVMGFSIPGPALDYTLRWDFEIAGATVVDFVAGFALDWGLGIRLPLELTVTSADPVNEGDTFVPTSTVEGLDWDATDFTNAGVPAEEGNEFVMHFEFILGVFLDVFGILVIDVGLPRIDIDESDTFTTPLGPGEAFSLPSIDIPLKEFSVSEASLGIGFRLTPNVGSDELNADWTASSEASGNGDLTFTSSGDSDNLSSVFAFDGPGTAAITADDFEYVFNQFILDLGIFVALDVFGVVEEDWEIPVTDFDLSSSSPNISMGIHPGSSPTAVNASVEILNVAPTAAIDLAGTTLINGVPTYLATAGEALTFTGRSTDPGRDDLTLSWDWGDGGPSPDVATTYPVPYDVTDSKSHAFGAACQYGVTFSSEDDDGAIATDDVLVIITAPQGENVARLEGYWQHQLSRVGNMDFDEATLLCYLDIAQFMSTVFGEVRDASTIPAAHDVMFMKQNGGSATERLDRALLTVWLNFANGVFGYDELVDTDGDGAADTPFAAAVAAVEAVRLDPLSTRKELRDQTRILHHMSVGETGFEAALTPDGSDRFGGALEDR